MDYLPVEVIGNILSHLGAARDVVVASATCRKWREAYCKHLRTLSFNSDDWSVYRDLTTSRLEILITQTLFQTTGLQGLSILMDDVDEFSAATVIAWLMYTRETLKWLFYNVRTSPNVNILEICGRQKLEMLVLAHNSITVFEPNYQMFHCLKSLSLSYVSISALDLNLLLTACPKIEMLALVNPEIAMSDAQVIVELNSATLKSIYIEAVTLDKFILEADVLEILHIKDCALELFELIGKGTLKHFKIDDVSVIHLDVGEAVDNLETVDVSNFTIIWSKFYQMISKSSKLRRLRLWDVVFDDEDEIVDLETIAVCFPQLTHLSLSYDLRDDLRDGALLYGWQGSTSLEHVLVLELGWTVINDLFTHWVASLLQRCPNLLKLIIHGAISETKTHEECQTLANLTSSVVELMRRYIHVDVQFEYE
ncbi:F-box/LRR-repeat protein At1g67190-like [Ipomoea triloba]|uniref:F-box/LRR-repeat protein At1g67190-like n=1 Tax=Ipomoea triloba TaxID=35885 RepID=UPI00125D0F60|nr:F-box/LRR-repeat protein At1g67190-like [Ipomoea triloba]GLL31248.1 F-box/LRR-repeat protein At1g67190 [Ipomoea trifida]GMC89430.1 F-box/LRR-repeat protein At1g67190-like isoform X1 [Ipomoea batatas]GMD12647.1 F-box/LRR-repeat protein At1g67190-like isoform X1 [Ipomoea batatas]GMD14400.1 F-box/LRR-repeat protein At1g67190-like isoform X1 [Ipomoea batatas]GMD16083.1 F-box/LRR-repeat protein At1g67190-like isoform X1 [Ipomoea batatas]